MTNVDHGGLIATLDRLKLTAIRNQASDDFPTLGHR